MVYKSFQNDFKYDNDLNGMILKSYQDVYVQAKSQTITYKFNVSALNYIIKNKNNIKSKCPGHVSELEIHDFQLQLLKADWNTESYTNSSNESTIYFTPTPLMTLNSQIQSLLYGNCEILENIISKTYEIHTELNKLAISDLNSMDYFIHWAKFQSDVLIHTKSDKFLAPYHPKLFYSEIWKYTHFKYSYNDEIVYLKFELPLFDQRRYEMFSLYAKPIIWKENAYMFNIPGTVSNETYIIPDTKQIIIMNKLQVSQNCHSTLNSVYCTTHKIKYNECHKVISRGKIKSFNENCFKRLNNKNMITQVGKNLYFTIFTPINIHISRNHLEYSVVMDHSFKITNKINYNVSTNFFLFYPEMNDIYQTYTEENPSKEALEADLKPQGDHCSFWEAFSIMMTYLTLLPIICWVAYCCKLARDWTRE